MVKIKRIVSVFFLALFVSYHAGSTLFSHTHTISGATIIHSHFHKDSHHNTKSGNHTAQSITLIAQVSHFDYLDFSCDCVLKPSQFSIQENKFTETTHWIIPIHLENLSLRAPPIVWTKILSEINKITTIFYRKERKEFTQRAQRKILWILKILWKSWFKQKFRQKIVNRKS